MKNTKNPFIGFKQLKYAGLFMAILVASTATGRAQGSSQESFKADSRTLAIWKMAYDANSTGIPDIGGGGYDLALDKGEAPKEVSGSRGKALAFEAGTACLRAAKGSPTALAGRKGVTVQAWIRPVKPTQEISMIAECFNYLVGGWRLGLNGNGTLMFTLETKANETGLSAKTNLCDGDWHLVEASHDVASGQTTLKVDGVEVAQKILKADWPEMKEVIFGIGNGSAGGKGWYYTGEIESLKISEGTSP